jgi:hypothetical protein
MEAVTVWRGDTRLTSRLGADYLTGCKVVAYEQDTVGRYRPIGWRVPIERLRGMVPLTEGLARQRRIAAREARYQRRGRAGQE